MQRKIYLGLQFFADAPQQLLSFAQNPLICSELSDTISSAPDVIALRQLDGAGAQYVADWLKQNPDARLTMAWPQPEFLLGACMSAGQDIERTQLNWLHQAELLLTLFRSARSRVRLVGYVPGCELETIQAPEATNPIEAIHQLAASHVINQNDTLLEIRKYLIASSIESKTWPEDAQLLVNQVLSDYLESKTDRDHHDEEMARLNGELLAAHKEQELCIQQLHDVQVGLQNSKVESARQQEILHKVVKAFEAWERQQASLINRREVKSSRLQGISDLQKVHIFLKDIERNNQHIARLIRWLRLYPQRYIDAAYHEIGSFKEALSKQTALIEESRFFDADWYCEQYPDIAKAGVNPAEHFIKFGAIDGRDPSNLFSTGYYITQYEDVIASGEHPLLHYLQNHLTDQREAYPPEDGLPSADALQGDGK